MPCSLTRACCCSRTAPGAVASMKTARVDVLTLKKGVQPAGEKGRQGSHPSRLLYYFRSLSHPPKGILFSSSRGSRHRILLVYEHPLPSGTHINLRTCSLSGTGRASTTAHLSPKVPVTARTCLKDCLKDLLLEDLQPVPSSNHRAC